MPEEYLTGSINNTKLSPLAEAVGAEDMEGTRNYLYSLYKKDEGYINSGPTGGVGVDFGAQSEDSLRAVGFPESSIKKAVDSGILGLKDKAADDKINAMKLDGSYATLFSTGELNFLSNAFLAREGKKIKDDIGEADWNSRTESEKAIPIMMSHQYGWGTVKGNGTSAKPGQNGYKQWRARNYTALAANLSNWGDSTPVFSAAINRRYANMARFLPPVSEWEERTAVGNLIRTQQEQSVATQ